MKSAARPRSRCACMTVKTRSARSDGSAAVISSRIRSWGSRASARARSSIRSIGRGHVERLFVEVDVEVELVQLPPHGADRRAGEPQVLRDGEVGHERGILEDGREPDPCRLRGRGDAHGRPVDEDLAGVRADHARQHLDEGALAGAVRAEERMHLPRLDHERRRPQSHHRAVALRDLACGEEAHACAEGRMPLGTLPSFALLGYGPLQPTSCAAVYVVHGLMNSCELYVGGRFGE